MFDDMSYDEIENMIDNIVDSDEFDKISEDFFKSIISSDNSKFNFSKKQTTTQLNENYGYIQMSNKVQSNVRSSSDDLIIAA